MSNLSVDQVKAYVITRPGLRNLYMRYVDPITGKQVDRTTGTDQRKEAVKVAAKWEKELQEGSYKPTSRIGWEEFKERYFEEVTDHQSASTAAMAATVFKTVEKTLNPQRVSELTSERVSHWQAQLRRGKKRSPATVESYCKVLRAALNWAHSMGMLRQPVAVKITKPANESKGRPLKVEEFERMLMAVESCPKILEADRPSWRFLMQGLWWGGLRLGEALALSWDDPRTIRVDLERRRPVLWIPGLPDKAGQERVYPLSPEFATFLADVPPEDRRSRVFKVKGKRDWASRVISDIGRRANVVVKTTHKSVKYASAHDLRRSFGDRWSKRLMPADLQKLMRHEDITTTMTYYVGQQADDLGDRLWQAAPQGFGEDLGELSQIGAKPAFEERPQPL